MGPLPRRLKYGHICLSGGFVYFVAEYARLRSDLGHAERHLNLTLKGKLAASHLGKDIFRESIRGAFVAATAGFTGALLPLMLGAMFSRLSWMTIAIAVIVLGLFGIAIAREVGGNPAHWAAGLMIAGLLLTATGILLHVA